MIKLIIDDFKFVVFLTSPFSDGIEGAGFKSSGIAYKIRDYILEYDIVNDEELDITLSHEPGVSENTEQLEIIPPQSGTVSALIFKLSRAV